jgi:hypothetical protein
MHIFIMKFFFAGLGNKELTYVPCLRYDYPDLQLMVVLKRRVGKERMDSQKRLN